MKNLKEAEIFQKNVTEKEKVVFLRPQINLFINH